MSTNGPIGNKARSLRESRGLSVTDLADKSGCSASLIEALESGSLAPSIAPLARLARALDVRLGTLMDGSEHREPALDRASRRHLVARFSDLQGEGNDGCYEYHCLAMDKADRHIEPFLLTLRPGATSSPSSHEGEEFLFVLSGEVEVHYGQTRYVLHESDSIYFDSLVPHRVSALGDAKAQLLTMVYCPT